MGGISITLNKGKVHSVVIDGGFNGPYINMEVSPAIAYELFQALGTYSSEIRDMVQNYYDCNECGQTHHKSVKVCPNVAEEDDE